MKSKFSILLFLFLFGSSKLLAQMEGDSVNRMTDVGIEQFRLSEETSKFFSDELSFPTDSMVLAKPIEKLVSDTKIKTYMCDDGRWRLKFIFPYNVTYKYNTTRQSLYIEFNQGIDSEDLMLASSQLNFLVKKFSNGYNTLDLDTTRDVFFSFDSFENVFILDIIPDYKAALKESKSFELAKARLEIENRRYEKSLNSLKILEKKYPDDKETLVLLSGTEALIPRWQKSIQVLDELHKKYPFDDDIKKLRCDVYSLHASSFYVEDQLQRLELLSITNINRFRGSKLFTKDFKKALYIGGQYQVYYGDITSIYNQVGNIESFKGFRTQGDLYFRQEWDNGNFLKGTVYAQSTNLGGGGEFGFLWPNLQGSFFVRAEWQKPYWALYETLAFHGREKLLMGGMTCIASRYFNFRGELGGHRVGITGTKRAFDSILASAEAYLNIFIVNPKLSLNYGYDAEYIKYQKQKIGENGQIYNPVPYQSFEYHTLRLYLYYLWKYNWYFTIFGGEVFNRLGKSDYTYGVSLKNIEPCPLGYEFEVSTYRFPSTVVQGVPANYYTINFRIIF